MDSNQASEKFQFSIEEVPFEVQICGPQDHKVAGSLTSDRGLKSQGQS
jgi:hypothetical protein